MNTKLIIKKLDSNKEKYLRSCFLILFNLYIEKRDWKLKYVKINLDISVWGMPLTQIDHKNGPMKGPCFTLKFSKIWKPAISVYTMKHWSGVLRIYGLEFSVLLF